MMSWQWVARACASIVITGAALHTGTATAQPLPPLSLPRLRALAADPAALAAFRAKHAALPQAAPAAIPPVVSAPGWSSIPTTLSLSNPVLLTDGSVVLHESCTGTWHRLTPDNTGSYASGTWSAVAAMPSGYAPRFFASAVLPDGRMIVEGGEYNGIGCSDGQILTNQGAIYDPVADSWTSVAPPSGWANVGDASGIVLADGTFMLASPLDTQAALLNPATLTWTPTGTGKHDVNDEENWTLLPSGSLLTVDTDIPHGTPIACDGGTEMFTPATGAWTSAGTTRRPLADCLNAHHSFEGPAQLLSPRGVVYAFGANAAVQTGLNPQVPTGLYSLSTKTWAAGPPLPAYAGQNLTMADAPAVQLPNGQILLAASPSGSLFNPPAVFFLFNGKSFTQTGDAAVTATYTSYEVNTLLLPTGEVLAVLTDGPGMLIYAGGASGAPGAWKPRITALSSRSLTQGGSYTVTGSQLSGLTQGAAYGDDAQADTNFPLVRIVNTATGHVAYARTSGFIRSVAPGAISTATFRLPAAIETGASMLFVVANGIASTGVAVRVGP